VLHSCTTRRERRTGNGFGTIRPVLGSSSQLRGSYMFGLVGTLLGEFGDARELTNLLRRAMNVRPASNRTCGWHEDSSVEGVMRRSNMV
jgi:hypothetical protein